MSSLHNEDYSQRVAAHARQHYKNLAEYLRQPYDPPHTAGYYQPRLRDSREGDFATLYDLKAGSPSGTKHLESIHAFETLIDHHATGPPPCSLLLFLKGHPSPEWINSIGARCNINPEFFQRHLSFWSTKGMPDYFHIPSLPSASRNIISLQVITIGSRGGDVANSTQSSVEKLRCSSELQYNDYLHALRTQDRFRTGDSLIRRFEVHDEDHFSIEQNVSICVNKLGSGWIAVIWLDIGKEFIASPNAKLLDSILESHSIIELYPVIGYDPESIWAKQSPIPPSTNKVQQLSQSATLLHKNYGEFLKPEVASADAFYVLTEIFDFTARSKRQFLNMLELKLEREFTSLARTDVVNSLSNFMHIKGVLKRHIKNLNGTIFMLERKIGLGNEVPDEFKWPQAETIEQKREVKRAGNALLEDFNCLLQHAETLSEQCDQGMMTSMNSAQIAESKRAIVQAERVAKLTRLGFFYIPLSFATGFFGMNFRQLGTGILSIWLWFLISAVLLVVSLMFLFYDIPSMVKGLKGKMTRLFKQLFSGDKNTDY